MKRFILLLLCCCSLHAATVSVNSPTGANTVLAGPTTGADANPTFRALVANDFGTGIINGTSLVNSSVGLTTKVTGVLPIANGGSNGATKQAGFDNLSPTASKGDLIVHNGTNNVAVPVGTNNFVLVADSSQAAGVKWAAAGTGTAFSGLSGGTNTAAAMLIGTGASLAPTGSGTVTANQFVGTGSTTNAVDLATAEVAGILTNAKGGTGADTSATGGAHNFVFQTSVGGAFTVAAPVEADLPATTAFTDTANTFSTVQTYQNYISVQASTPAQITADVAAYDPGAASYCRATSSATWNVQGIINGVNGRVLDFVNAGSSPIVLANQNASATAANRIITPTGADMTLASNYGAELIYDATDSRWRVVSIFQSGGGAGISVPSGTSGGIPYYSAAGVISGSGALTANAIVFGGGAGSAPSTPLGLGTTTQILHGNAGGLPTWGQIQTADIASSAVDMATKMTGTMQAGQEPAHTGDVTNSAGSLSMTIANTAVTAAKMVNSGVFTGDATSTFPAITISNNAITAAKMVNGGVFTGDVTTTFPAITIGNSAITNAKIANGTIDLTAKVTGALPIANGGTGQTTSVPAFNALAPTTTKGDIIVSNGTNNVRVGVGSDNQVLTADSTQSSGVKWGAAGGATAIAPLVISGSSVAAGTAIAPTTTDANADFILGASGTTKTPLKFQSKLTNTAPLVEGQNSVGTVQWQVDNTTNSRADITEKLQTTNQANIQMQSISENVTIAASATSTSATNLLPANSFIVAVTCRVTTVIPTASTFKFGFGSTADQFGSGISTANGTTASSMKQTPALAPFTNTTASTITITPNATPGAGTGTLRITVFYFTCQEPQN